MRVENMQSRSGNKISNQFIITDGANKVFQSYNSIIAEVKYGVVYLDKKYWNYSRTTSKYRNLFLGETKRETEKKIKSGEYLLANLNG